MTKFSFPGRNCATYQACESDSQVPIQFQDEGVALGTDGTIRIINFVGAAVTATRDGNALTITITGGGSFDIEEYNDFEDDGLPTGVDAGYIAQLKFVDTGFSDIIDGVQYYHNKIIYWNGTHWISWAADYGATT